LSKTQLAILNLLAEQENGQALDSAAISIALGMSRDYLSVHPPLEFLKTNLVIRQLQRTGPSRGYVYHANLVAIAKVALPTHHPHKAAQKLLELINA
jgi:hypothetical protein